MEDNGTAFWAADILDARTSTELTTLDTNEAEHVASQHQQMVVTSCSTWRAGRSAHALLLFLFFRPKVLSTAIFSLIESKYRQMLIVLGRVLDMKWGFPRWVTTPHSYHN